jgi:YVTN family beta-propeller protein/cysteine-rich repeat protein
MVLLTLVTVCAGGGNGQAQTVFSDGFNRATLGTDWRACGSVSLVADALHMSHTGPTGCTNRLWSEIALACTSVRDATVQFDLDNGGPTRANNAFEVHVGSFFVAIVQDTSNDPIVEDRRSVSLYGPTDRLLRLSEVIITPGRYEFSVAGSDVRFRNVSGGTTIDAQASDPTPSDPGPLVIRVNEEALAVLDNVEVTSATAFTVRCRACAYVMNQFSGTISVIDTVSDQVVSTIATGSEPTVGALTPGNERLYVTNYQSMTVSVVSTLTNGVMETIPLGERPGGIVIAPDGTKAYVVGTDGGSPGSGTNHLFVIDIATNSVSGAFPSGGNPNPPITADSLYLAISPDGQRLYVANRFSGTVSVVDTSAMGVIGTIPVSHVPVSIAVSPDGSKIYVGNDRNDVADPGPGLVWVIDTQSNTIIQTLTFGDSSRVPGLAFFPSGLRVYAALSPTTYRLAILNVVNDSFIGNTDPVTSVPCSDSEGGCLRGVSISPTGDKAYVTLGAGTTYGAVAVVDTGTNGLVSTIPVGHGPATITISSNDLATCLPAGAPTTTSTSTTSSTTSSTSTTSTTLPNPACSCGDGIVQQACEQCDLGAENGEPGSGCSADCQAVGQCTGGATACQVAGDCPPTRGCCGNGVVEGDEECDDGNHVDLDCCSALCETEATGSCEPLPAGVCDVFGPHLVPAFVRRAATRDSNGSPSSSEVWRTSGDFNLNAGQAIDPDSEEVQLVFSQGTTVLYDVTLTPGSCPPSATCFLQKGADVCAKSWKFQDREADVAGAVGWKQGRFAQPRSRVVPGTCGNKIKFNLRSGGIMSMTTPAGRFRQTIRIGDDCATAILTCTPTSSGLKCASSL